MPRPSWSRVKEIVDAYYDEQPDDRAAWLDRMCAGNEALRREVVSLLDADADGRIAPDDRAADRVSIGDGERDREPGQTKAAEVAAGDCIGPYRIQETIGVGGMSVVYEAERTDAEFEQTVAVKLLHRQLGDEEARRRFRAERQVLASLNHPAIAQLVDGGLTDDGRPYLVMERVDGTPITEYARGHDLGLETRLDLLKQVAEAVQAAHGQLVVHRDLKPSNVLVTDTESGPQVKLLDFGIAKLLDDTTLPVTQPRTQTGRSPMTPSYAAPEQVRGEEVTTQTDVYQLGMLAYELLAGARPFDVDAHSPLERKRIILEDEPPRLSDRAADTAGGVAAPRLQGDLDTILRTALRKEPERRYRSVEALQTDLRRYRTGQPIEAQPATVGYRAKKFVQRNAPAVAGVAAFVLVVSVLTGFYVRRIAEERDRARREAEKAEQVSAYLTDLLQSTQPSEAGADTVTAAEMLRRGRQQISQLDDRPAVQARMLHLLGVAYRERADYDRAQTLLRQALAIRDSLHQRPHRAIATTLEELARVQVQTSSYEQADSLLQIVLADERALYGTRDAERASALHLRGQLAYDRDRTAAADSFLHRAAQLLRTAPDPDTAALASVLQSQTALYDRQDEDGQAVSVGREALRMQRQVYGPAHPDMIRTLDHMAGAREDQRKFKQAEELHRRALRIARQIYDAPHPRIADVLQNLAVTNISQGELGTADSLLQQAVRMNRTVRGPNHPSVGANLATRGSVLARQDRFADAIPVYEDARRILRRQYGDDHYRITVTNLLLGRAYVATRDFQKAEPLLKRCLRTFQERDMKARFQNTREVLAKMYDVWDKPERAEQVRARQLKTETANSGGQQEG